MRISRILIPAVPAVAVSILFLITSPEGGGRTCEAAHDCDDTALAVLEADKHEANAEYWMSYARCLNGKRASFSVCEGDASDALQDALDLAQDRYEERLDVCALLGGMAYDPDIDPSEFSLTIDNPYLPSVTNQVYVYEKRGADGLETLELRATRDVAVIGGFRCRAIRGLEKIDGVIVEDTTDWLAQRDDGTVWYFGEISRNYEDGILDNLEGSWRHGKDDAKAGIVMLASPAPGHVYRQEYQIDVAEDVAMVVATDETVTVRYGTFTNCLKIVDWSPLEPGVTEWKYYAKDVGFILEVDPVTGERLELVRIGMQADVSQAGK